MRIGPMDRRTTGVAWIGVLLAALSALLAGIASAQPVTLDSPPQDLARAALGTRAGTAVAAVWRDGQAQLAGLRDGQPLPAEALTGPKAPLFEIGSISKVFTGLLLAQAEERGELNLDDSLGALLKGTVSFTSPQTAAITLRQLVTHTACLPRLPADFNAVAVRGDPYRDYDRARLWAALGALTPTGTPPCAAVYSNLGFAVLGEVLSLRAGKPWDELVRDQITRPLGMADTLQHLGEQSSRLVPGFVGDQPTPPWQMQAFAGTGALRATAEDLLRFGRALAAGRSGPLGAASERLVTPLARLDGDIGHAIWVRGPAERRTWLHGGATGGYRALLLVAPDRGQVLVVLASNAQAPFDGLQRQLLGSRYPVAAGTAVLEPAQVAALSALSGVYPLAPGLAWTFVAQDGQLWGRVTNQPFTALLPAGPDTFTLADRVRFDFVREGGRAQRVRVVGGGTEFEGLRSDRPVPARARVPQDELQPLVGRYQAPQMSFVVQAVDGQLWVRLNQQPRFPVFPVAGQDDRYAYEVVQAELQFERYRNGTVSGLVLHQNGRVRAEKVD